MYISFFLLDPSINPPCFVFTQWYSFHFHLILKSFKILDLTVCHKLPMYPCQKEYLCANSVRIQTAECPLGQKEESRLFSFARQSKW